MVLWRGKERNNPFKFDPKNKNKLDTPLRRWFLPPARTLKLLGLEGDELLADIGAGTGYYSIPLAKMMPHNKVYALDISEEMLRELQKKAERLGITNIVTIQTDEYNLKLPDETITFALAAYVLHEIEDKERFLIETRRILKRDGRFAVVEWERKPTISGPPLFCRIRQYDARKLLEKAGFHVLAEYKILWGINYIMVGRKLGM